MKTKWQIACLLSLMLPTILLAQVKITLTGPQHYVGFTFENSELAKPLSICSPNTGQGAIYFETRMGKTWLKGNPFYTIEKDGCFYAKWRCDQDQIITASIIQNNTDYLIRFSADNGAEILKWGFALDAMKDEYFTGLLERTVDGEQKKSWAEGIDVAMDLRGQIVEMMLKHTVSLYAPFYISSRGYGLAVKGTWPGFYDLCKSISDKVQVSFEGPTLSMKLYTSKSPAKIVQGFSLEAGPTILPPKWVFGCWRWRNDHTQRKTYYDGTKVTAPYNSEVVEDILMMQALDIPCSVYWVDRPWAKGDYGYDDFEWDTERLPNPVKMIQWLESKDVRFLLWIAPWVMGDMADEAVEKGYNVKAQKPWKKTYHRYLIDFTNPQAKKWWQQEGLAKVLNVGVKGFKLDRAEEIVPETRDAKTWDGRTTRETRNDYPVQYVRATYEICKEIHGDDFVLLPRAGYPGSSRYATFWGGDIRANPEGLRCAIIAQLRSAIIGYPLWGSDTCGYGGPSPHEDTAARWLAFSCFSPIMEVGPTKNKGLWNIVTKENNEPHYNEILLATWRLYAKLHTELMDYTYACAKEARETGMPIARPLFLMYPEQKQAWQDWQTFQYGPDILVSAIWKLGVRQHPVYLPKGRTWIDAWDKKEYPGGQTVTIETPVYKIPIFIRKGADIDLGDLNKRYKESLARAKNRPNLAELQQTVK